MKANSVASRFIEKWNLHSCLSYLLKAYQNWQDNQTLKWNFPWKSPATQTLPVAVYSKSDEIKITINNFLWKWEISSHLDQATFFHYSFFGWIQSLALFTEYDHVSGLKNVVIGWATRYKIFVEKIYSCPWWKRFSFFQRKKTKAMNGKYTKYLHLEKLSDNIWRWFTINAFCLWSF